ncbi:MAG: hypothetical protein FJ405_13040 [Verrucomicrobia bacterium]|nr:hypothetical protein [Verrucomicrobiota bacterium]
MASINGQGICLKKFEAWMKRRGVSDDPRRKESLLDDLLAHESAMLRVRERGLDRDPALQSAWEQMLVTRLGNWSWSLG